MSTLLGRIWVAALRARANDSRAAGTWGNYNPKEVRVPISQWFDVRSEVHQCDFDLVHYCRTGRILYRGLFELTESRSENEAVILVHYDGRETEIT